MRPRAVIPARSGGFRNRLVEHTGSVCLVERRNPDTGSVHWEVWRLRWQPHRPLPAGDVLPAGWRLPSSAEWGDFGWTYVALPEARERYRSLVARTPLMGGSTAEQGT